MQSTRSRRDGPRLKAGVTVGGVAPRRIANIRDRSLQSGMMKPAKRNQSLFGPVLAATILIVIFGGYILFAWLAGDV